MALIKVSDLTFGYEGSIDNIFEEVSFNVDTDWKLGFIGRNGKGKTTFLRLLMGNYEYKGSISSDKRFDYFPYEVSEEDIEKCADEIMDTWKAYVENWRVICELSLLGVDAEVLYRPFKTLSFGERTKVMLAVLFSGENEFLLIDEPTNHLDKAGREIIKNYLSKKKGFILVSHDRELLDAVVDHVLVLNKESIQVQAGNFSCWQENKERADAFAKAENEKHEKEISKLKVAADRASRWAEKNEATKIGFNPIKEHDRCMDTRAYIGAKTKKMQSRVKAFEGRIEREIEEKEGLLNDIETVVDLKINQLKHYKKTLVRARDLSLKYNDSDRNVFENKSFELNQGDILFLTGENGCGKTSLIKAILERSGYFPKSESFTLEGELETAPNLTISYINQDTSNLTGNLKDFAKKNNLDYTLLLAILQQLDFEKKQYVKDIAEFSQGQKKKVLIASSLITPAHLFIWDEPLNYIDVFSRMQIEKLIEKYSLTMIVVEHDTRFKEKLANKEIIFYD